MTGHMNADLARLRQGELFERSERARLVQQAAEPPAPREASARPSEPSLPRRGERPDPRAA